MKAAQDLAALMSQYPAALAAELHGQRCAELRAEITRRFRQRNAGGGYWRCNARAWIRLLSAELRTLQNSRA